MPDIFSGDLGMRIRVYTYVYKYAVRVDSLI